MDGCWEGMEKVGCTEAVTQMSWQNALFSVMAGKCLSPGFVVTNQDAAH